ncbi:hypothetical protein KAU43_09165 [candidate division WOR-3 bacterium]|nr:hypothetical protein [candidate division WOR-3 bacterium]
MKIIAFMLIVICFFNLPAFTETSMSGELNLDIIFFPVFPYTNNRFDGILNYNNFQNIHDLNFSTNALIKYIGGDDKIDFNMWLYLSKYNIVQPLLAASYGDTIQTAYVYDVLNSFGGSYDKFDIYRANIGWYIGNNLLVKIGRQNTLSGYGYAWNPSNFINPVKNPFIPYLEIKGVDALSFKYYYGNLISFSITSIYRSPLIEEGIDFKYIQYSSCMKLSIPKFEIYIDGFYDYDRNKGEDSYVPAIGAGTKIDIAGVGIYGEGALLVGSRNIYPSFQTVDSMYIPVLLKKTDEIYYSYLIGAEYTFGSGFMTTMEYYYNGEGYSREDRENFKNGLDYYNRFMGYVPSDFIMLYKPGSFAKQYIFVNLFYPLYDFNLSFNFSSMYSIDSYGFNLIPSVVFEPFGCFAITFRYLSLLSLKSGEYNEEFFSPVKNIVQIEFKYNF